MQPRLRSLLVASTLAWTLAHSPIVRAQSESEFMEQLPGAACPLLQECSSFTCDEVWFPYEDVDDCDYDASAAGDCLGELEAASCNGLLNDGFPAACDDAYGCTPCLDDSLLDPVGDLSAVLTGQRGVLCPSISTDVNSDPTPHPDPNVPPKAGAGDQTEILAYLGGIVTLGQENVDTFLEQYPCGLGFSGWTVCVDETATLDPGEYAVFLDLVKGDVPLNDSGNLYQYSFALEADGDPDNNYMPLPQFPNDTWSGADQAYSGEYNPSVGWGLNAFHLSGSVIEPFASSARMIIDRNMLAFIVPAEEFALATPQFRATTHCHLGDFRGDLDADPHVDDGFHESDDLDDPGPGPGGGGGSGGDGSGGGGSGGMGEPEDDGGGCACRLAAPSPRSTTGTIVGLALFSALLIRRVRRRS